MNTTPIQKPVGKQISAEYIELLAHRAGIEVVTPELALFAEILNRAERTARIEAQQRLADMQELAAKAGLAHRKAVQSAVSEAVAAEREACAVVCESLFVPDQVLGAHPDYLEGKHMAKSQCVAAIRARGMPSKNNGAKNAI